MTNTTDEDNSTVDETMRQFRIGETAAGGPPDHDAGIPVELPLEESLRGRAFICGKSGSGKSNTASVLIERILDAGRPLLIIDVEGEYYGLKESYEVLHAGADDVCDIQVGPEHGEKLAQLGIEQGVPIILDLSGFLDEDEADELVGSVASALFATAKQAREPFPVFVEECHEFLPQRGSAGETGERLVRISKRGRKHGLGLVGISQRPASVDKDFITQANLLIWHRLTWDNDTKVVGSVLGKEYEREVDALGDGEAFLDVDPDVIDSTTTEVSVDRLRVQIDRKQTYDAGEAPGLGDETRPELQSVDQGLVDELQSISDREQSRQDEIERLRSQLERREADVEELEEELADTKDIRGIMSDMMGSIASESGFGAEGSESVTVTIDGTEMDVPEVIQAEVMEIREERQAAESRASQLADERARYERAAAHLATRLRERPVSEEVEDLRQFVDEFGELTDRHRDVIGTFAVSSPAASDDADVKRLRERARKAEARADDLEAALDETSQEAGGQPAIPVGNRETTELLKHDAIQKAISAAAGKGSIGTEHYSSVLGVLANGGDENYQSAGATSTPLTVSESTVRKVLKNLHTAGVVTRERSGRGFKYALDRDALEQRIDIEQTQAAIQ